MAHWETISYALCVSYEGLLLDYEEAMTRRYPMPNSTASRRLGTPAPEKFNNTSAHFLWWETELGG